MCETSRKRERRIYFPSLTLPARLTLTVSLRLRIVSVIHFECKQAKTCRSQPAAMLADPSRLRVPASACGRRAHLKIDEPIRHAALVGIAFQRAFVPRLPRISAVIAHDLRRVIVVVQIELRPRLRCSGRAHVINPFVPSAKPTVSVRQPFT